MQIQNIRTRLAPSPTGYLHIGTLRTALYCYLLAKKHNGQFLIRIEDTDQKREVEGAVDQLLKTLQDYKLFFDEGPQVEGPHSPYIQSQRLDLYNQIANQLLSEKKAYRCFCTSEELTQMREEQQLLKKPPMYDRRCRHLTEEEIQANLDAGKAFTIRQAIPLNQTVEFKDVIKGHMKFDTNTLDDHVLMKTDGFPTYHLAGIVDDWKMNISHVMRGDEWLPSTPKHILLFQALGATPPTYVHLSLILNKDGTKLSKRKSDVSASSYLEKGYDVDAILNFIALLGWNPGDNREIFSLEELVNEFSLERLQKSGAIFDLDKLNWFNWQWRRRKYLQTISQIAKQIDTDVVISEPKKGHLEFTFSDPKNSNQFQIQRGEELNKLLSSPLTASDLNHLILSTFEEKILKENDEAIENIDYFYNSPSNYNTELFLNSKMGVDKSNITSTFNHLIQNLQQTDFTSPDILKEKFIQLIQEIGLKNGQVLWPTRIALSNQEFSPGVFEIGHIIGYQETIQRLKNSLQLFV